MKINFSYTDRFENRHHGSTKAQIEAMLDALNVSSIDELIDQTVPSSIRLKNELKLPNSRSEYRFLKKFKKLASQNELYKTYIGMGYNDCITPGVILRNVLENPGWYTAYTPYQAEIAQGRLEALINFQTMVTDLTGMELANASLLDEATAAAEAMTMFWSTRKGKKKQAVKFFVSESIFPQTKAVLETRAVPLGIELIVGDPEQTSIDDAFFGAIIQYPDDNGAVIDWTSWIGGLKQKDIQIVVAADLLSLALLTPPGEMGADVVVGTSQRFGVPMGYGGPHAAFFATKESYKRQIPGRIIGLSVDVHGNEAYRMALQTREQHIRREKATSNICTAQVLLAVIAGFYAVYHGEEGVRAIASRVHGLTRVLDLSLEKLGFKQLNKYYFDTLKIKVDDIKLLKAIAENEKINFRYFNDNTVGISLNETAGLKDLVNIVKVFEQLSEVDNDGEHLIEEYEINWPASLVRKSAYLTHPVFKKYHTEHEMLRYLKKLENKDLSLAHSMISLGSCTMKLNATAEMIPVTWDEFGKLHPFVPVAQAKAYDQMLNSLNKWLCEITGFASISFQPNSGAQGEYAGLMVIRAFHEANGEANRDVVLIPSSAHGTNPASAVMAGMKVVIVACDERGNIDFLDLKSKVQEHKENLAGLMVTYPSTHGVFEEGITDICKLIHENGGQVYMDGANMNAQVGLTSPANIGADVCHLNLHKTFCIPHGGGGPGMGPIGVAEHLKPYLAGHPVIEDETKKGAPVSAAPYGSASILPISYAYIAMMGGEGLTNATKMAILNANYIKSRLEVHYPILYSGAQGRCAHEMIVDFRQFKHSVGIEVEDIAKRLMDYGFHAPTVSFPVAGTLMIEPTESETKEELDRFCDALIAIREEIKEIEDGGVDRENNVLKNAPHTADTVISSDWDKPYSREKAVYPIASLRFNKFWPSVGRIDSAYGDRNLYCSCIPVAEYQEELPV